MYPEEDYKTQCFPQSSCVVLVISFILLLFTLQFILVRNLLSLWVLYMSNDLASKPYGPICFQESNTSLTVDFKGNKTMPFINRSTTSPKLAADEQEDVEAKVSLQDQGEQTSPVIYWYTFSSSLSIACYCLTKNHQFSPFLS